METRDHRPVPVHWIRIRDGVCAVVAIFVTISLSWSFVHSTQSLRWMGSDGTDLAQALAQAPGQDIPA